MISPKYFNLKQIIKAQNWHRWGRKKNQGSDCLKAELGLSSKVGELQLFVVQQLSMPVISCIVNSLGCISM